MERGYVTDRHTDRHTDRQTERKGVVKIIQKKRGQEKFKKRESLSMCVHVREKCERGTESRSIIYYPSIE